VNPLDAIVVILDEIRDVLIVIACVLGIESITPGGPIPTVLEDRVNEVAAKLKKDPYRPPRQVDR